MDTTTDARRPLTPAYVADQLGVSPRTIHRAIADGSIRAIRVGRRWKVPAAELDRLLAGERVAA